MIYLLLCMFALCMSFNTSLTAKHTTDLKANIQETLPMQPHTVSLSMQEAIDIAIKNKPSLQAYKHVIEAYKIKSKQVWSEYLPHIAVTTNISQAKGQHTPQTTVDLSATQLVYAFDGPIEQYKKAKKVTQQQELLSNQEQKKIRHEVEVVFLECWKLQQQNAEIKALHTSSTTAYQKAAHQNKLELLDKSDWLKSNTLHAQNLATIETFYQNIGISQKKLEFLLGQPIDLNFIKLEKPSSKQQKNNHVLTLALEWKEPKSIPLFPVKKYYQLAMQNRNDLQYASKSIAIAKDDVRLAQRANLPRIALTASTGYNGNPSTVGTGTGYHSVGTVITWNLFNGLHSDYDEKIAHANMLKEILGKEQTLQNIQLEVDTAYLELSKALTQVKAKKAELTQAKNDLLLKKQQFKIGDISKIELDAAHTAWEVVHYAWIGLKTDASIKMRDLAFACGYPKEL